jgi:hypothetical protein
LNEKITIFDLMRVLFFMFMGVAPCFSQSKVLYHSFEVTYIGLNALDLITTYKIIDNGGYEANPLMTSIIQNKPLAIGVKTISTTAFLGACRIIRRDRPKLAFALLLAGNLGYGALVSHNYQVYFRIKI